MDSGIIYWLKAIHDALKSLGGSVTVVEGTVATDAFTPASGQPTFATALARIAAGNFVYLKYEDSGDDVYELVTAASDDAMATKNVTWSAE